MNMRRILILGRQKYNLYIGVTKVLCLPLSKSLREMSPWNSRKKLPQVVKSLGEVEGPKLLNAW